MAPPAPPTRSGPSSFSRSPSFCTCIGGDSRKHHTEDSRYGVSPQQRPAILGPAPLPLRLQQVPHFAPPDRSKTLAKDKNYFRFLEVQLYKHAIIHAPWLEGTSEATSIALRNSFCCSLSGPLSSSGFRVQQPCQIALQMHVHGMQKVACGGDESRISTAALPLSQSRKASSASGTRPQSCTCAAEVDWQLRNCRSPANL